MSEHVEQVKEADAVRQALLDVRHEVSKAVVGQDATVTGLLIALLAQGHVLLEGVPEGIGNTRTFRQLLEMTKHGNKCNISSLLGRIAESR